jgi:hypothetical protein
MKTFRVLLVSVISFCLLNVQMVMTTQGLRVTTNTAYADACPEVDGDQPAGTDCSQFAGGVNSQNFQTTQTYDSMGADTQGHGLMNQIMLLAIGFIVAGWFLKCVGGITADMIIAAVGAGILILGEIVAIGMYQGAAADMEMQYQADHEGKMLNNDDQVEAFRKELDNNEQIKEALETKLALQIAAEVAFLAAMTTAIVFSVMFFSLASTCLSGAIALVSGPQAVAFGPTCGPAITLAGLLMAIDAVPQPSLAEVAQKKAQATTTNVCTPCIAFANLAVTQYYSGCVSFVDNKHINQPKNHATPSFGEELLARIENERPEMSAIAKTFANDYNDRYFNNDNPNLSKEEQDAQDETIYEALVENGLTAIKPQNSILAGIPFSPLINPETDNEFDHYLAVYENNKFKNGEVRSLSLDEYETFSDLYSYNDLPYESQMGMKEVLKVATQKGLDLIFPKAEANFGQLLTIVGGVLLAVIIANNTVMDLMLGTGTKRAITFGLFGIVVAFGIAATLEDLDSVNTNIDKLNEIINNLSDLNSGPMVTHTGAPDTGGSSNGIDRPQVKPQSEDISLNLEDNKPTPCLAGGTPGNCNDVQEKFKAAAAVDGLNLGGELNSTANTITGIGNEISGTKLLSGTTLGKIRGLGKNKGALLKMKRSLTDDLNKLRKKQKNLGAIDFDKESNKLLDQMRKATLKKLKEEGMTPAQALAKSGITVLGGDKKKGKDDKALKDAKTALAAAKGKPAAAKKKAPKIGFDFGDNKAGIGGGDAEEMEDPNVIGDDEEYVLDDIVEDKGASLWQIISVRYLKSGYNRLSGSNDKKAPPAKISE